MLWEVEIFPKGHDVERGRVEEEYELLTHATQRGNYLDKSSRGFLLQGRLNREHVEQLAHDLLGDPVAESLTIRGANASGEIETGGPATVLLKPGVMDPVAMSIIDRAPGGVPVDAVQTFRRYYWTRARSIAL